MKNVESQRSILHFCLFYVIHFFDSINISTHQLINYSHKCIYIYIYIYIYCGPQKPFKQQYLGPNLFVCGLYHDPTGCASNFNWFCLNQILLQVFPFGFPLCSPVVDTQFCTHSLILEDGQNDHSHTRKIIVALHALIHSLHIIKMILRF